MANVNGYARGIDEDKINKHYQSLNNNNKKSAEASGKDVSDLQHKSSGYSGKYTGPMKSHLMTWTKILESLEEASDGIDQMYDDISNTSVDPLPGSSNATDDSDNASLLDELNRIFTPVLVMQGFEAGMEDQIKEACEQSNVLTEKNIIKFDDQTRMSQLITTCALLIDKQRNTPEYKAYQQAAQTRNKLRLGIVNKNYKEAEILAQQYLVKVSTTNNSPVARDAANDLLPQTQH